MVRRASVVREAAMVAHFRHLWRFRDGFGPRKPLRIYMANFRHRTAASNPKLRRWRGELATVLAGVQACIACSGATPSSNEAGSGGETAQGTTHRGGAVNSSTSANLGGATASSTVGGASMGGTPASSTIGGANVGGAGGRPSGGATATLEGGSTSNVGGGANQAGSSGSICSAPTPWDSPATSRIVGDGTAASCTAAALSSAVTSGGHVTFACGSAPVTIAVASAIRVTKATVVEGAGLVTLDGGGTSQIFVVASNAALSVRNLRFINGKAPDNGEAAGIGGAVSGNWRSKVEVIGCIFEDNRAARGGGAVAVWTGSALTIVASRFYRNRSWYGGAVYSLLSPLQVINCEFVDNSTLNDPGPGDGGAIGTDGASESPNDTLGGSVEICGTQIRNSQGYGSGGGAYIWVYPPDRVIIDRTTLVNNVVSKTFDGKACFGGAMRISNGAITIKSSSFLSNGSETSGGALYLDCAPTCHIENSTFYANKAAAYGGAIFSGGTSNQIDINNATFANNLQLNTQANAFFGGAAWRISNSIFLDNGCASSGTGANVLQWSSTSKSAGSGACIAGVKAADPMLSPPADNGGPTFTMLPATGSGALQAGADCAATDQRGQSRNVTTCDLGAVELP